MYTEYVQALKALPIEACCGAAAATAVTQYLS